MLGRWRSSMLSFEFLALGTHCKVVVETLGLFEDG